MSGMIDTSIKWSEVFFGLVETWIGRERGRVEEKVCGCVGDWGKVRGYIGRKV